MREARNTTHGVFERGGSSPTGGVAQGGRWRGSATLLWEGAVEKGQNNWPLHKGDGLLPRQQGVEGESQVRKRGGAKLGRLVKLAGREVEVSPWRRC